MEREIATVGFRECEPSRKLVSGNSTSRQVVNNGLLKAKAIRMAEPATLKTGRVSHCGCETQGHNAYVFTPGPSTSLSFREARLSETQFPRIRVVGSAVSVV